MVKTTLTFDEETTQTLWRAASRLKKTQSAVVREAIQDYANRTDRMMARVPKRTQASVDAEIREVRAARRS